MSKEPLPIYFRELNKLYKTKDATELTYRPSLKNLIQSLYPDLTVFHEPKRQEFGSPDFRILKNQIPLGYIEAKDIGKSLDEIEKDSKLSNPRTHDGRQLKRYNDGFGNLILTDHLEFRWYYESEKRLTAKIAVIDSKGEIRPEKDAAELLARLLEEFLQTRTPSIRTPKELAGRMASLARHLKEVIYEALKTEGQRGPFHMQLEGFQKVLLPSLNAEQFADLYAQTIPYGLFSAKSNYTGKTPFNRVTAGHMLPKTNPFLRKLFDYMAGVDMDNRVAWIVDDLAELLNRTDIEGIIKDFNKKTGREDPIIHFYETFLAEYDKKLRKVRGVYYTPEPVVSYIVRSIDHILKTDFGLKDGLADKTKIKIKKTGNGNGTDDIPKVIILDPAVGTGTFLHGVIDNIYNTIVEKGQAGAWSDYVSQHLIPRLFGFELLIAPYTIAHMKLDLQLKSTGYDFSSNERLNIFLTNSLEEAFSSKGMHIFENTIANEANEAAKVKQDLPVMVVLGNPPYSGHSENPSDKIIEVDEGGFYEEGFGPSRKRIYAKKKMSVKQKTYIGHLLQDYFKVDGKPLGERNPKWLNDDYVKFIRMAQHRIESTGYGILAFITNHSYLDNPTFRGMRQSLMNTFDDIYILNLHGNSKKKEKCPDGSKDENVFDIQQGVAIGIYVKKPAKHHPPNIKYKDMWGVREIKKNGQTIGGKYYSLMNTNILDSEWARIRPIKPYYLFTKLDIDAEKEYYSLKSVTQIFGISGVGMTTARDDMVVDFEIPPLLERVSIFRNSSEPNKALCAELNISLKKGWNISASRELIRREKDITRFIKPVTYRPFDNRVIFYHESLVWRVVKRIMQHMLDNTNIGIICTRQTKDNWGVFCTKHIMTHKSLAAYDISTLIPLYLSEIEGMLKFDGPSLARNGRWPNLEKEFLKQLSLKIKMDFIPDGKGDLKKTFGPEDVLSYIYAVFHSPSYRKRYSEFLKIDFPRLPLTSQPALFRKLCELGSALMEIHLMEAKLDYITRYPIAGNHEVVKIRYTDPKGKGPGKVWIYDKEFFEGVTPQVWEFYIGGYQVCDKWLKDRKSRNLTGDEIEHYQYIVSAITKTIELMSQIDQTIDKYGGWPIK